MVSPLAQHLHAPVRGLASSPTLAIAEASERRRREGLPTYRLGFGQSPFPVPQPVVEALRANAWRSEYLPVRGLAALREAVAEYYRRRHGLETTAEDVLVAPGSKELMFLLQVVFDGELVIPTPAWVSYGPQARLAGRSVSFLETRQEDDYRLMPEALERVWAAGRDRPRVLVLNSPSNPTSRTYRASELEELAVVVRRHGALVLSDEIYGDLQFDGAPVSMSRFYPEGTVVASGLSKWCGAGGWRLGTFIFPPALRWLLEAMAVAASESYTTTSAPIQHAAVTAFTGGPEIDAYVSRARRVLAALVGACRERLLAAGARVPAADAAFYLFPDLSGTRASRAADSRALCRELLQDCGVAALPGADFGRPAGELTLRLALVDFDGAAGLEALLRGGEVDGAFLRRYCGPVLEAVERLAVWISG